MPESQFDIADARRNARISACPGLFRIVRARDGGICRLKLALGHLSGAQARTIAAAARQFGNGAIDVTNRANLQLRGLAPAAELALIDALLDAGLGPTAPAADDIRNVMVSPTAGIDRDQEWDVRPLARALLARLENDTGFRALSPKFSILVDGGEGVAALDRRHDIWLAAMPGGETMALGFAGTPPLSDRDEAAFAMCRIDDAIDVVAAAIEVFLAETGDAHDTTRMRHLFARRPAAAFHDRLSARLGARITRGIAVESWRRRASISRTLLGVQRQRQDGLCFVGAMPPLGRLAPAMLVALADAADQYGDGTLRLTPWTGAMIVNVAAVHAGKAARALAQAGFADVTSPLSAMIACSGMTGCAKGLADTQADARRLAAHLATDGATPSIHLTGCAKSCAAPAAAAVTLLASAPGRYDMFVASKGGEKFGRPIARDLGIAEAAALIAASGRA
jgi:precorrin-3B synthase